ncbi:hypothetical protein DTO027B5_4590 [Paecilomyces variotii]|nr:hypothetical protein DTO169C6_5800 [Paecilomyces variotii]KAJ9288485.1 hypothetical protein DTO021C3_4004 [Paecilomyces variotii]KAJ9304210.1 hypothetical protein DTO217A2_6293 [Paecilomyces variotii]KAJ9320153.1 hypothetical protein DTO027B3_8835 [Paecilomyces variotii]KAJ9333603.1 hypothetical protein DTO027B5_4590 [Paecilomyces variotii]
MGKVGEHWRDVKAHRKRQKRQKLENPPGRRCWDWMLVMGSCHYARNRSSFKEYRRVGRTVSTAVIPGNVYVAGVGTVELMVRSIPKKGSAAHRLILYNVLHIPKAICNGFCFTKYHRRFGGSTSFAKDGMQSNDAEGHPLWYGEEFHGLDRLALDGNPQGETLLSDGPKLLSLYIRPEDLEEILS